MPYLLIQIALLMIGAYLVGAIAGCLLRRLHDYVLGENTLEDAVPAAAAAGVAVPPVIEVAEKDSAIAGEASRFEKALSHGPQDGVVSGSETTNQSAASSATASADAGEAIDLDTPTFSPIEDAPSAPAAEPTPPSPPVVDGGRDDGVEGEAFTAVSIAAAAAAAAMAARASDEPKTPARGGVGTMAPEPVTPDPVSTDDIGASAAGVPVRSDLTRIKGITEDTATRLNATGVVNYDQIAGWQASDVAEVEAFLDSPGSVSRGNWIEQARILASGGVTAFARDLDAGLIPHHQGLADTADASPAAADAPSGDDDAASAMPSLQVSDVRMADGDAEASSGSASDTSDMADRTLAATVAAVSAAAAGQAVAGAASKSWGSQVSGADALESIYGVDAPTAGLLNGMGVTRFDQIANWSERDVSHYESALGATGRIGQERWIEQAQFLARGEAVPLAFAASGGVLAEGSAAPSGEPAGSVAPAVADVPLETPAPLTPAPAATPEQSDAGASASGAASGYEGFRSVRSQALRGDAGGASNYGVYDDLKRIRGVGLLIERKLNGMGVFSYEQVANWSLGDIERVSQALEFKGRIERENWVEQARILAAGGATEFSTRVDRGSS